MMLKIRCIQEICLEGTNEMDINEVEAMLNNAPDIYEQAIILRDNVDVFIEFPNNILKYLDALEIYCDKCSTGTLLLIFKEVETNKHNLVNKIMDICVSSFYFVSNIEDILDNFTQRSGSFIYIPGDSFLDAADLLFKTAKKGFPYSFNKIVIKNGQPCFLIIRDE